MVLASAAHGQRRPRGVGVHVLVRMDSAGWEACVRMGSAGREAWAAPGREA